MCVSKGRATQDAAPQHRPSSGPHVRPCERAALHGAANQTETEVGRSRTFAVHGLGKWEAPHGVNTCITKIHPQKRTIQQTNEQQLRDGGQWLMAHKYERVFGRSSSLCSAGGSGPAHTTPARQVNPAAAVMARKTAPMNTPQAVEINTVSNGRWLVRGEPVAASARAWRWSS